MKLSLIDALAVHATWFNSVERPESLYLQARQVLFLHSAELRRLHEIEVKEEELRELQIELEELKK